MCTFFAQTKNNLYGHISIQGHLLRVEIAAFSPQLVTVIVRVQKLHVVTFTNLHYRRCLKCSPSSQIYSPCLLTDSGSHDAVVL